MAMDKEEKELLFKLASDNISMKAQLAITKEFILTHLERDHKLNRQHYEKLFADSFQAQVRDLFLSDPIASSEIAKDLRKNFPDFF